MINTVTRLPVLDYCSSAVAALDYWLNDSAVLVKTWWPLTLLKVKGEHLLRAISIRSEARFRGAEPQPKSKLVLICRPQKDNRLGEPQACRKLQSNPATSRSSLLS